MVEPVNTSPVARMRLQATEQSRTSDTGRAGKTGAQVAAVSATDQVSLSSTESVQVAKELAQADPPFEIDTIKKIKTAIREGRYPIDLDKITESLFQGYQDMLQATGDSSL